MNTENKNNLFFTPAAHFKVVMNRSHFENTFSAADSVINNLQNVACTFNDVDNACKKQNQRTVESVGKSNNRTAQKH